MTTDTTATTETTTSSLPTSTAATATIPSAAPTTIPLLSDTGAAQSMAPPTLWQIFFEFLLIGAVSFGGGIVAYERILLIEKRRWLSADSFMATLAISQTMPGLNSVNLALLAGDQIRGVKGALAATIGLMLPGGAFVLLAGVAYSAGGQHPFINVLLAGIAAGATGLLASVTYTIGKRHFVQLKSLFMIVSTFVLMSVFKLSLVWVLIMMVPIGLYLYRPEPQS
ncbi:MAG: chromate transporter [Zwartia sp.]